MRNAIRECLGHDRDQRTMHLIFDPLLRRGISRTHARNNVALRIGSLS